MILKGRFILASLVFFLIGIFGYGQECYKDTVKLSLSEAEHLFLRNNLSLLAEKYHIESSKALAMQERLFNNPNLSINQSAYNPDDHRWLQLGQGGEMTVQVQQLFLLAGKRNKRIKMAGLDAEKESKNYFDLLRTLEYSLCSGFYNLFYLNQSLKVYQQEIASLESLIRVFEVQQKKGFVSMNEVVRLKSALFALENEQLGYKGQLLSALSDFNVLIHTSNIYYEPIANETQLDKKVPKVSLSALIDTALVNRYDLLMARADVKKSQLNVSYQKSLAIPDVTLSAGWDKTGGYVKNYNFIGMQFDLPFLNRNQGNIRSAQMDLESDKINMLSSEEKVKGEVIQAYSIWNENEKLYWHFDSNYMKQLDALISEIVRNFQKKNISLVDFLNYYDAYKQNRIQYNTLKFNRINAIENLNFSVGKKVIDLN